MPRYYVSIPFGWLDAKSPQEAVDRLLADDPRNDHEGVTFLVREEGSDQLSSSSSGMTTSPLL